MQRTLSHHLLTLENAELVRLMTAIPEVVYLFRHALVQEAAYGSLVRADRRQLHRAVAECLEQFYRERGSPADLAAHLAQHFDHAEDARALDYAEWAAEAALGRYANAEAVDYFTVALRWARRTPDVSRLSQLYAGRGRALELGGQYQAAFENYVELGVLGTELDKPRLQLQALVLQGQLRSTGNMLFDLAEGEQLADAGLALAQRLGDRAAEAKIHWNRLNLRRFSGDNLGAQASGEASLALARQLGLTEQMALTLNDLVHVYGALSAWSQSDAAVTEASQLWRDQGNLPMLADSLATGAMYAGVSGDLEAQYQRASEAYQISLRINNAWGQAYSLSQLSLAAWHRADYGTAIQLGRECLRQAPIAGYVVALALHRADLAIILADAGQVAQAEAEARLALAWAKEHIPIFVSLAQAALAAVQLYAGDNAAAGATLAGIDPNTVPDVLWIRDPIRHAAILVALAQGAPAALGQAEDRLRDLRENGLALYVPEALLDVAQARRHAGRLEAAQAALTEALEMAQALGLRRVVWAILYQLAEIEADQGDHAAAERRRAAAAGMVNEIAAAMPTADLRQGFLLRAAPA